MHKTNKFASANVAQLYVDVFFLCLTYGMAYLIASQLTTLYVIFSYLWILIIFIPLWISIMAFSGMYDNTTFYYFDRILRNVAMASLISGMGLGTMFFFIKEASTSRLFIGIFFLLCFLIMSLERCVLSHLYRNNSTNSETPRIIVVCSHETRLSFYQYLRKTHIRYNIVGVVQVGWGKLIEGEKFLGRLENLGDILKKHVVDEVFFDMPKDYTGDLKKYFLMCEKMGITVHLVVNLYDFRLSHSHIYMLGPLPVLTFHTVNLNPFQKAAKRLMDILGAVVGIFVTLISSLIIVPAIKMDSPGPVIFKQSRVGRQGRVFNLYKFRTMYVDAEAQKEELMSQNEHKDGLMFKIKEDPRITRVGAFLRKTSLDELPQFFNVLKGEMSLVGTRPPTLDEVELYDFEHRRRISIKPGLTGMWQVSGRSNIKNFNEVLALDNQYIDNWSIGLDISILMRTVSEVVKMKSAC